MKGLDTCWAYRIDFTTTGEKHTCIALEHRQASDRPQCIGENKAKECAFYRTHAEQNEAIYRAGLRNLLLGIPIDEQQSEQIKVHRRRGQGL